MGASSGKLVITDKNAVENTTPEQPTDAHPEAANQGSDDAAPNWDFKPIDEPEETPTTLVNGHAEGEQTADGAVTEGQINGDITNAETTDKPAESAPEKTPKKHKNPLIRIPLRLSKINFSFNLGHKKRSKTATTEAQEQAQDAETVEQKPSDSVIEGVADNLVQEVITSAAAVATSEEQTEAPQSPDTTNHSIQEVVEQPQTPVVEPPAATTPTLQETPQQIITEFPTVVNNKEEIIVNGGHENHEQINNHILDSNNTNSTTFEYVNGDSHPIPDSDAIAAKLTSLELTNGHSDHIADIPIALNGQDQ